MQLHIKIARILIPAIPPSTGIFSTFLDLSPWAEFKNFNPSLHTHSIQKLLGFKVPWYLDSPFFMQGLIDAEHLFVIFLNLSQWDESIEPIPGSYTLSIYILNYKA
jgi:hypothetical protein